jgi:ribose transport system substrate-binding protein
MFKLWRRLGFFALLPLTALPACNNSSSAVGSNSGGKPRVAFISNNAHEFWTIAKKGTEAAAKEFGVEVEFKMPPNGTSDDQRKFIEDLRTMGVKCIAISPNDSANQVSYFKRLNRELPVIAVDNDIPDADARQCYIGTDNVTAGRAVGKLVRQVLPDGGQFMIFVGKLDSQNAQERRLGVVTELAGGADKCAAEVEKMNKNEYPIKFGKWELLDTRTDDVKQDVCRAKAEDALNKYPDMKCMVGLWAYNPPAMLGALKSQNKVGKVTLIGFDENDETLDGIRDGSIFGTVVQDPYNFGYEAVKMMAGIAKGDAKVFERPDMNAQKQIYVRHRIVNRDGKPGSQYGDEKVEAVDPFQKKLKQLKGQ